MFLTIPYGSATDPNGSVIWKFRCRASSRPTWWPVIDGAVQEAGYRSIELFLLEKWVSHVRRSEQLELALSRDWIEAVPDAAGRISAGNDGRTICCPAAVMSLRSEDLIGTHSSPPCGTGERLRRLSSVRLCAPPFPCVPNLSESATTFVSTCKEVEPWPFRNFPGWALTLLSSFGECKAR